MRVIQVTTDADGRSSVEKVLERSEKPTEEVWEEIFTGPLTGLAKGGAQEEFLDMSPGSGAAMWRVYDFPPGLVYDMHHTSTIDFDVVIEGSMTLSLDSEDVPLEPGDAVLLRGDRHAWRAGEEGCRMLFALLGAVD